MPRKAACPRLTRPGIADQHHERDAADAVDEDEADVAGIVGREPRHDEQRQEEGDEAIPLDTVAEQVRVLLVRRLEHEAHVGSDLLSADRPEHALRPDREHDEQHDVRGDVLEALRQVRAGEHLDEPDGQSRRPARPTIDPNPPSTAAANALSPTNPRLTSMSETGASRTPANAATPAEIAQMSEKIRLTGMPM